MIAREALEVGDTVWFRGPFDKRAQRGCVEAIDAKIEVSWRLASGPHGVCGGQATLPLKDLFSSAAAYHVHRIETGPWSGVLNGKRSLHDGPLDFFEAHKRYYHALARLELAQRVVALRRPVPPGGYTKTTRSKGAPATPATRGASRSTASTSSTFSTHASSHRPSTLRATWAKRSGARGRSR